MLVAITWHGGGLEMEMVFGISMEMVIKFLRLLRALPPNLADLQMSPFITPC
jgi:hypothetical protein